MSAPGVECPPVHSINYFQNDNQPPAVHGHWRPQVPLHQEEEDPAHGEAEDSPAAGVSSQEEGPRRHQAEVSLPQQAEDGGGAAADGQQEDEAEAAEPELLWYRDHQQTAGPRTGPVHLHSAPLLPRAHHEIHQQDTEGRSKEHFICSQGNLCFTSPDAEATICPWFAQSVVYKDCNQCSDWQHF